jgi:hypothetical protein
VGIICVAGWLLVLTTLVLYRYHLGAALGGLFLIGTLLVAADRAFPNRRAALAISWVGPMLLASVPLLGPLVGGSGTTSQLIVLRGSLSAIVVTWLVRGYGLVLFVPILARLLPGDHRASVTRAALEYPWRYWWTVPLGILALFAVLALASLGVP